MSRTPTSAPRTALLDAGAVLAREAVGGKAVGLARLREAGAAVPRAFCVTAAAYREFVAGAGLEPEIAAARRALPSDSPDERRERHAALRGRIAAAPIPGDLRREIDTQYQALGAGSVAVRSSATDEDRTGGAFAGLHDTFLNVVDLGPCLDAIRRCWASLWSERACVYRAERGLDHGACAMAVIVQEMIGADASGVVFSADPVSGERDRVIVEASYGLGEAVVSGRVTPDRFILSKRDMVVRTAIIGDKGVEMTPRADGGIGVSTVAPDRAVRACVDEDTVRELARIAVDVEDRAGGPQDLEWATRDGAIHLLQARPATALPEPPPAACEYVWSNVNAGEVMPDVVTPITWSLLGAIERMFQRILDRFGIDIGEHPPMGRIAGRIYFNISVFAAVMRRVPFFGGRDLDRVLGGAQLNTGDGKPLELTEEQIPAIRANRLRLLVHLPLVVVWIARHRPRAGARYCERFAAQRPAYESLDLAAMSDPELLDLFASMVDMMLDDPDLLAYPMSGMLYFTFLERACGRWLGDEHGRIANGLLAGSGGVSSADAGLALWDLARAAHGAEAVARDLRAAVTFAGARSTLAGHSAGRAFLERWDAFVREHGHHTRGEIELLNARWSEDPDYLLSMVRSYLDLLPDHDARAEYDALASRRETLTDDCRRRLRNPVKRALFDRMVRGARAGLAVRENLKSEAVRYLAIARSSLLELGARLEHDGVLRQRDDVFFFERGELPSIPGRRFGFDARTVLTARRRQHEINQSLTPPPIVIGRLDAESLSAAPPAVTGDVLTGIAVSPGRVTGPARVILRATDDAHVRAGEILVAPFTDPGWTPYFVPAAGIVMDLGGLLSHGSIVAREYGKPAVVNVGPATRTIRTGEMIEVDGDRGIVRLLERGGGE